MKDILERFLTYARIGTMSSEESKDVPSTEKQFALARLLESELKEMGAGNVHLTDQCYLYAEIPGNLTGKDASKVPKIGLIAHLDTTPSASDRNISPRIIRNYDGKDIPLNGETVMKVSSFPELASYRGEDLIVTDGRTLLGADDKAGVAEIMQTAEYLLSHPEIPHGKISVGFTPDEEIGRGSDHFDLSLFDADFAYTVDGGTLGEINFENFNAASCLVTVKGVNVHPGSAKNKMINASLLAMEYNGCLPPYTPANTEGYEGFFHLCSVNGDENLCEMKYLIRDHDRVKFEEKKEACREAAEKANRSLAGTNASVSVKITDQYFNMKEKIEPCMFLIDCAKKAFTDAGVTPAVVPVRGGTDGAKLSFLGLPCPNLSAGGENFHGIFEYLPVRSLRKMHEVLLDLVREILSVRLS